MSRVFYTRYSLDNIKLITQSIIGKRSYECIIPFHNNLSEILISRVIAQLLKDVKKISFNDNFSVIINELVTAANIINIYYSYKESTNEDISLEDFLYTDYYKNYNKKENYIKIDFKVDSRAFFVNIEIGHSIDSNISSILGPIFEKSKKNIDSIKVYNRLEISIFVPLLILTSLNISSENIKVLNYESKSSINLIIPFNQISKVDAAAITDEIHKEIEFLPQFPESIIRLQKEIMDPDWDYNRITDYILSDPALTAEILRLVNSPVYKVENPIDKVSVAIKKIGINGLKSILLNFGSFTVLEEAYNSDKISAYKDHMFKVAVISSYLANLKNYDIFAEDIYVAALMHDLGKIILDSLAPELLQSMKQIISLGNYPPNIIDYMFEGYNHSIIGAFMGAKWNFPKKYIETIKFHHNPDSILDEYKIIAYCVYLGNEITHMLEKNCNFNYINNSVLEFFNLDDPERFDNLLKEIKHNGLMF